MRLDILPLITANALAVSSATVQHIDQLLNDEALRLELDPLIPCTLLDDIPNDIDSSVFYAKYGHFTGEGVRVAVLDSGVDVLHPHLNIADSISTCGENVLIPGAHGTHCAGILASQDTSFRGIAPGVALLNIKVSRSNGLARESYITSGVDEALNMEADVISLSLGFNQLPTWSSGGHGWNCINGDCVLCTSVNNAFLLDNVLVVVAAGNYHQAAATLRQNGYPLRTELCCPAQATHALTVGAISKTTHLPADFSSRGPSAFSGLKPDLVAPGINVISTSPLPRTSAGLIGNPARSVLFVRKSGTSTAAPIVAGVAALLMEREKTLGMVSTAASIKSIILSVCVEMLPFMTTEVGAGRVTLRNV